MKSNDADMTANYEAAMSIGQIAERAVLATHVLRHWESMGLLSPRRNRLGQRSYTRADLYQVALILRAKEAGFGLGTLREMFTVSDPAQRRTVLERQRTLLQRHIAQAQMSLDLIDSVLECKHHDFARCANFQAAVAARIGVAPPSD